MEWIENQPVFFGEANECSEDEITFAQLVDNTDDTQVQFRIEPCPDAEQLFTDPNFDQESWAITDQWSIADNMLCGVGVTGLTNSADEFDADKYYQIEITVDSISVGGSIKVSLGSTIIGYLTSTGTFTFYGFPVAYFGNTSLILDAEVEGTDICISQIGAYEIKTNVIIPIYTSDGTYVNEINYTDDPDSFVISQNTITATIDWSELGISNGCYYMCLLDPCENTGGQNYPPTITNCEFTGSATGWDLEGSAAYSSNTIVLDGSDFGFIYQEGIFDNTYSSYCVKVNVTAISGTLTVQFGTNVVGTITATGIHTITGIPNANSITVGNLISNTATITSVCACEITTADYECNLQSNVFKLGDYTNACTLIINACNNEDSMGFVFTNSGFSPRVRLEAKLRQAKYANERTVYDNSIGTRKNIYFSGRKQKNLCIDLQPEYVHDFLRLLLGFDNVYINNETYSVDDDEYNVEYSDASDDLGKVRLLVSKRTQNVKNINCSEVENSCTLPPNYLLQADDASEYILFTDNQQILING